MYTEMNRSPAILTLETLDRLNICLWANKRGWFYASRTSLKAAAPTWSNEPSVSPAVGPFKSAVEAGRHALTADIGHLKAA